MKSKKHAAGIASRSFFVSGVPVRPGDYVDGPEVGFLLAVQKLRPFDPAVERVAQIVRDGATVRVAEARKEADVAASKKAAPSTVPDETWTNAQIREWIVQADPDARVPANAGKTSLLEAVQDLLRTW